MDKPTSRDLEVPPIVGHGAGDQRTFLDPSKSSDRILAVKIGEQIRGSKEYQKYVEALAGSGVSESEIKLAKQNLVGAIKGIMESHNLSFNSPAVDRQIKQSHPNVFTTGDIVNDMEADAARMANALAKAREPSPPNHHVPPPPGRPKPGGPGREV
jgi:hypothetical protein